MSHEITINEDGFAEAAYALEPAWHGLGQVLDHAMTAREAMEQAHLNWGVEQRPLFQEGWSEYAGGEAVFEEVEGFKLNVREDTGAPLGVVTNHYKVIQNIDALQFLDALVEGHELRYEAAMSLSGGRRVILLAQMPGALEVVKGDHILPYILLSLAHDGSGGVRFGPTGVRVVCANTFAMADADRRIKDLSISHTGNITDKLEKARSILAIASDQFAQYAEQAQSLCQRRLNFREWEEFLDILCPIPDKRDPDWTKQREDRIEETRGQIWDAYRNPRQNLEGMERTPWAAYNAVSEYIDHLPRRGATEGRRAEARFNVTMFGPGRDMKRRAFETATRFAEAVG